MDSEISTAFSIIKRQLNTDRMASELKWFWFRAALFSYKRDFLLRPFPPTFRKPRPDNDARYSSPESLNDEGSKDFDRLIAVTTKMPPFSSLDVSDDDGLNKQLSLDQIRLLAWVLDTEKVYSINTTSKNMYEDIKKLTGQQDALLKVAPPDYIFRVEYDEESESRFRILNGGKKTIFAYHGSKVANFHSITRNGLRANMNQVSVYGEGTYLSPELSVSLNWSPMSAANSGSTQSSPCSNAWDTLDGARLSCVAVCELIDDTENGGLRRSESTLGQTTSGASAGRRGLQDVPDRYILVKNDDLLRIRYILAYVDRTNAAKMVPHGRTICDRVAGFCNQHRFSLLMLFYFLLLSTVGLANSSNFHWYVRRFWTTAMMGFDNLDDDYSTGNFHRGYEDT